MNILVINCGSSSIKCTLFAMPERKVLADCMVEKIGEGDSALTYEAGETKLERGCEAETHTHALEVSLACFVAEGGVLSSLDEIAAVGHRVVHGAEKVSESVAVDDEVIAVIKENFMLAPLHNPPNLMGLEAAMQHLPGKLQVAVFDTAFHTSMPKEAYLYALPYELYEKHGVRRYGFHGTSHRYVSERAAEMLGKPLKECNLITLHLGNGCSMAAVREGRSVDTSMGMTPLEGLVMGTRSGDIDPALPFFLDQNLGMKPKEVYDLLNRESGLAGLSGVGNDMREIIAAAHEGNEQAELALKVFCYRARKYVGAYLAALERLDAVVFTAGIGENAAEVRRRICSGLDALGICLDEEANEKTVGREAVISKPGSPAAILVVPTDEALKIAIDAYEVYLGKSAGGKGR